MRSFAARTAAFSASPIREMVLQSSQMAKRGIDVVLLHQGEPDFPTPPNIIAAAKDALDSGDTKYVPAEGSRELKEAIQEKLRHENGISNVTSSEILVTNGAKLALFVAVQALIDAGDEVLGVVPYFGPYRDVVTCAGGRFVTARLVPSSDRFELDRDQFRASITRRTKAFLVNTPQNPSGTVWARGDLEYVADLAEQHDCYILADEVYEKILFDGRVHHSIASLSPDIRRRTVLVNSFSKTYSMTGWRLGYAMADSALVKAMADLHHASGRCATAFVQKAGIAALTGSQASVAAMVSAYQARRDIVQQALSATAGVQPHSIEGTFYAFPDISQFGVGSATLAAEILESAHVAVVPGAFFGDDACIRISFATSTERLVEGLERMQRFFQRGR